MKKRLSKNSHPSKKKPKNEKGYEFFVHSTFMFDRHVYFLGKPYNPPHVAYEIKEYQPIVSVDKFETVYPNLRFRAGNGTFEVCKDMLGVILSYFKTHNYACNGQWGVLRLVCKRWNEWVLENLKYEEFAEKLLVTWAGMRIEAKHVFTYLALSKVIAAPNPDRDRIDGLFHSILMFKEGHYSYIKTFLDHVHDSFFECGWTMGLIARFFISTLYKITKGHSDVERNHRNTLALGKQMLASRRFRHLFDGVMLLVFYDTDLEEIFPIELVQEMLTYKDWPNDMEFPKSFLQMAVTRCGHKYSGKVLVLFIKNKSVDVDKDTLKISPKQTMTIREFVMVHSYARSHVLPLLYDDPNYNEVVSNE